MRDIIVRRWRSIALALTLVVTAAGLALAANPHFVGRITATLLESDLLVS